MKAVTGKLPVTGSWAYELKWDGMRIVAAAGDPDHTAQDVEAIVLALLGGLKAG